MPVLPTSFPAQAPAPRRDLFPTLPEGVSAKVLAATPFATHAKLLDAGLTDPQAIKHVTDGLGLRALAWEHIVKQVESRQCKWDIAEALLTILPPKADGDPCREKPFLWALAALPEGLDAVVGHFAFWLLASERLRSSCLDALDATEIEDL